MQIRRPDGNARIYGRAKDAGSHVHLSTNCNGRQSVSPSLSGIFLFFLAKHQIQQKYQCLREFKFFFKNNLCFLRNTKARWRPRNLKSASVKNTKCSCLAFIREPFMRSVRRLLRFDFPLFCECFSDFIVWSILPDGLSQVSVAGRVDFSFM